MNLNINRENFERLAAHLENLVPPPEFGMAQYTTLIACDQNEHYIHTGQLPECGTVACAAGHGPVAGIVDPEARNWRNYVVRNFVLDANWWGLSAHPVYRWCFSGAWSWHDDTPTGAAKRIRYMLAHGIPEDFRYADHEWLEVYADA